MSGEGQCTPLLAPPLAQAAPHRHPLAEHAKPPPPREHRADAGRCAIPPAFGCGVMRAASGRVRYDSICVHDGARLMHVQRQGLRRVEV